MKRQSDMSKQCQKEVDNEADVKKTSKWRKKDVKLIVC